MLTEMASGAWLFATNPDQWSKLRADARLLPFVAGEIVRMESPLQNFTRVTTVEAEMSDGSIVPAGSRVIVSYASANRDERKFEEPDRFRIDRAEKQSMGFGHGPHGCAGQGLARMELSAVFGALAARIERFELAGEPDRVLNNIARGFRRVPLRAVAG